MPRVSNLDRARIVEAIEGGHESKRAIAIRFNVDPSTVRRIYDKFLETYDVKDRPKSGRPRCTTAHEDRFLCTTVSRNRRLTCKCIFMFNE